MLVTALFLYAIEEYCKTNNKDDSTCNAVDKGWTYLKDLDKKYTSIYFHLELGNSWENAAANVAKKCRVSWRILVCVCMCVCTIGSHMLQ